jgi:hypothetical protein
MAQTTAERLAEAEKAYHSLMLGNGVAEVRDSSGESVRYTQANASRLRAYIMELKQQLAAENANTTVKVGPLNPLFG